MAASGGRRERGFTIQDILRNSEVRGWSLVVMGKLAVRSSSHASSISQDEPSSAPFADYEYQETETLESEINGKRHSRSRPLS